MTARSRTPEHPSSSSGVLRSASAALLMGALLLSGCASSSGTAAPDPTRSPQSASPSATVEPSATPTPAAPPVARGEVPRSVSIPAIGLDAPLIDLGIAPEGQMEVPADYDEVGWFTGGGRPGGFGPTVIAGHVDSPTGAAVFFRLKELKEGDAVEVIDAAGTTFRYTVTAVADYPKSSFPTQDVFGAVADDELRLITCGGVFDASAASYVDNRVVYAVRAPL